MIEIRNLKKRFGDNHILKGVDININQGDVVAIIGPSGSGKTTLLRCLSFLEHADEGEWRENGTVVSLSEANSHQIYQHRQRTGFVFQNYNLFANKTVLENVMLGLTVGRKVPKAEAEKLAREALAKVGMLERADFYPNALSGGQQQRVGIARAVVLKPEVILFDEPTSALDPEMVGEVLDVIRGLASENITMILVTHEITFAKDVASKVIFMADGVVCEEGTVEEVLLHPKKERTRQFLNSVLPDYSYVI